MQTNFEKTKGRINEAFFGVRRDGLNKADVLISGYLDDNIGYFWKPGPNGSETVTFHRPTPVIYN